MGNLLLYILAIIVLPFYLIGKLIVSIYRFFKPKPEPQPKPQPKPYYGKCNFLELDTLFEPTHDQIIYIESQYDKAMNNFIKEHYVAIKDHFKQQYHTFCYLPYLANELSNKEVVDYYAPYASEFKHTGINSDYLLSGLSDEKRMEIGPSLLYYHSTFSNKQESNKKCFRYISLDLAQLSENMAEVLLAINADIRKFDNIRYSLCDILRNGALEKYVPAEILDEETWKLFMRLTNALLFYSKKAYANIY